MIAKRFQTLLHKELSYQIQGAAMEVRKNFGPGHKESLYQSAFAEELQIRNINFQRESGIKIYSPKTQKFLGIYRPDFIAEDKVIFKLKATEKISKVIVNQLYDYLRNCLKSSISAAIAEFRLQNPHRNSPYLPDTPSFLFRFFARNSAISLRKRLFRQFLRNSRYELGYFINFASPWLYLKRVIFTNDRKPFLKSILAVISLILVAFSVLPVIASAQTLSLKSTKTSYHIGESFNVSLSLNTGGKSVNTLAGTVDIPIRAFQILDARYGNSIISLWIEKPKVDYANGYISFTGGVPGGFKGEAGPILSFGLKAKKVANATVKLKDMKALLNDGLGTEVKDLILNPLTLGIVEAPLQPPQLEEKKEEVYKPPPDTVPPEPFIPIVSRHPSISNNAYFVSFFAVDKDTGISHYEISERPLILTRLTTKFDESWVRGESPSVLRIQWWPTKVMVRAYDQAGNSIEAEAIKPMHPALMAIFIVIAALLAFGVFYKIRFRKH